MVEKSKVLFYEWGVWKNMSFYENIFIGRQDLSQQQMEALGANLCLFITQNGGDVVRSEYCGFRNLAYPIKKSRKGHYYIIQLKADGPLIKELERVMRINEDIIRQLTVRVDEFVDSENIISQAKTLADIMAKDAGYRHASDKTVVTEEVAEEVESASTEVQE